MKRTLSILAWSLVLAAAASALDRPLLMYGRDLQESELWKSLGGAAKVDTVYILGGPGRLDGKFQDATGQPDWQGWTSSDLTAGNGSWSVTSEPELVIAGDSSLWCGVRYPEPGPIPVPGFGYGNYWGVSVVYTHTVPDNSVTSDVVWTLKLQFETEPGYDFVDLDWKQSDQWLTLQRFDGNSADEAELPHTYLEITHGITYDAGDYTGPDADQIQLRIHFMSDEQWSDQDGHWPTARGACQVDDISIAVNGVEVEDADFEDGTPGNWVQVQDQGVGDFAALYTNLSDLDPCITNWSSQVAFVDDGVVVPGTGGTVCITWCYGPGGYIVNNTGGMLGADHGLRNIVISPTLVWPADQAYDDAFLVWDVYVHEELGAQDVWPGVFYRWAVRSVDTGDPLDIELAPWRQDGWFIYGGPDYYRTIRYIAPYLVPGRTHLQVSLQVWHQGGAWGWVGVDGTPAPYFDNVAVGVSIWGGPDFILNQNWLAQDNFPTRPTLDFANLVNNAVRFDMADGRSGYPGNVPGDSIIVDVFALQAGSVLADRPKMHVKMKSNPLFDGVRVLPPGFIHATDHLPDGWGLIEGWVYGDTTYNAQGNVVANRFNFDLPDTAFFFPGDVIHYYFEAEDDLGGVKTLPGILDGFGEFDHHLRYWRLFTVHALPTMKSASPGDQPRILFWNDGGWWNEGKWLHALHSLGYHESVDYDTYCTLQQSTGVGNGLGGRATEFHLAYYDVLLYTCGDALIHTLSNGDPDHDAGDDISLLSAWLAEGKSAFMTGNNLVSDLFMNAGAAGQSFLNNYLGVTLISNNLRPYIHDQTAPLVRSLSGQGVIVRVPEWIAYGGCPWILAFDACMVNTPTVRLAEFTDHYGQSGAYYYTAASQFINPDTGSTVVLMPYDFITIMNAPGSPLPPGYPGIPSRAIILEDILESMGMNAQGSPLGVLPEAMFAVSSFPNPFNPMTTIKLSLVRNGDVSLKVFNIRGELVQTLVDGPLEAGAHDIIWDGTTGSGSQAASGVYFCEARQANKVKIMKLALVR